MTTQAEPQPMAQAEPQPWRVSSVLDPRLVLIGQMDSAVDASGRGGETDARTHTPPVSFRRLPRPLPEYDSRRLADGGHTACDSNTEGGGHHGKAIGGAIV